jgi:hypothetical protein
MRKFTGIICILVSLCAAGIAPAQTRVVVIPLGGEDAKNLKNVITVAKAHGDFTNPVDAINSIPTTGNGVPSFTNRYLIVIGPGMFAIGTKQIVMREWVSIQGAGQEATLITGAVTTTTWDATSAIVVAADNAAMSDLTINNTGGLSNSIGIWFPAASPRLERLTVVASGATHDYGLVIFSSSPTLTDVTATGTGFRGISLINSSPFINECIMEGEFSGLIFDANSSGAQIVNSKIIGGVSDGLPAEKNCTGNYDEDLLDVNC